MTRPLGLLTLVFLVLPAACSRGSGAPVRQADGSYSLSCKGPLSDCLRHAERLCRDKGYTVTEGRNIRDLAGHESGQSQVLLETSSATIYCGSVSHATRPPVELKRESAPEPVAPVVATPVAPPPPPPAPAPACVPGNSQACVGPAGCSGGQACKADGTGYEPCNCGK